MKGIAVIIALALLAAIFNMTTILWIFQHVAGIAVTALVISATRTASLIRKFTH